MSPFSDGRLSRCGGGDGKERVGEHGQGDVPVPVANWNSDPRPFIGTKTAEEILESLARFCSRFPGAER